MTDWAKHERERRAARRLIYIAKFGGCCSKCGSVVNLQFHHNDPSTKISHRIFAWPIARIEAELLKCSLLCKACHHAEHGYGKLVHGTLTAYNGRKCRCATCREIWRLYYANWKKR